MTTAGWPIWLFVLNVASTWYMVGLIWMVQVVHYKMFDRVGEEAFTRYAVDHARLITPIVGLPMLVEIATAAGLLAMTPPGMSRPLLAVAFGLLLVNWISTAALQVPCHEKLSSGFDVAVYERLVTSNWIRTIAWTARGGLLGYLLIGQLAIARV